MLGWRDYAEVVIGLFVVTDPVGAIPIFISLTSGHTSEERRHTAVIAARTVGLVLMGSLFVGEPLLRFFGISIASFRVAGGILMLLMALSMLQARISRAQRTPDEAREAQTREHVGVVPLGIPLLGGPGCIGAMVIYGQEAATWWDTGFLVLAGLFVSVSVWSALRLADPIGRLLGRTGINVVVRLFGLILAAIAVEFIAGGLAQLLPGLARP